MRGASAEVQQAKPLQALLASPMGSGSSPGCSTSPGAQRSGVSMPAPRRGMSRLHEEVKVIAGPTE